MPINCSGRARQLPEGEKRPCGRYRVIVHDLCPDDLSKVEVFLNGQSLELIEPVANGGMDNWVCHARYHDLPDSTEFSCRWEDGHSHSGSIKPQAGKVIVISARDPARTGLIDAQKWAGFPEV